MTTENQDIVFPEVQETRIYLSDDNEIVIRQNNYLSDDHLVVIPIMFAQSVIDKITSLLADSQE